MTIEKKENDKMIDLIRITQDWYGHETIGITQNYYSTITGPVPECDGMLVHSALLAVLYRLLSYSHCLFVMLGC